ncbi:GAF domain-like protein [Kockovaella imperatae]|uniref:GAF domain-like protein n=1 Tax=Kockovaella imperatae TaxID=4999 RepID=A0A1Y1UJ81_9TREE|nr:GAF domain-like protein [Kockovaella imperatae]ORX37165.1 GAF domain-like protein [Kockovaella imperatae]
MPHADSSLVPNDLKSKTEFYAHVHSSLEALLGESRYWVSNLAQTASLLYHAYLSSPLYGLHEGSSHVPVINWVGFYLYNPSCLPSSSTPTPTPVPLGPYHGRPACVEFVPRSGKGVCADAFTSGKPVLVQDVHAYPGHIACDGDTMSEIVLPLVISSSSEDRVIGVLDLDSTVLHTFNEEDREGLQKIVELLRTACDWK